MWRAHLNFRNWLGSSVGTALRAVRGRFGKASLPSETTPLRQAGLLHAIGRFILLFVVAAGVLRAEPAAGEAEVAAVKFNLVRPSGGGQRAWYEADVQLNVRPAPGSAGQLLSRVRVTLLLGFDVLEASGAKHLECYRAEAEAVALGPGRASVRFYLPPEIVQRDAVRGDARHWSAEATVGGRPQAPARARHSPALAEAAARRLYAEKSAATAAANEGILLPQYLTPFVSDYPNDTPSFVRRETGR
jgi:hypothetical protein